MMPAYLEMVRALRPEAILTLGALLALGFDLAVGARRTALQRQRVAVTLGALALVGAAVGVGLTGVVGEQFGGTFILDPLGVVTRLGVLLLALVTLLLMPSTGRAEEAPAETVALLLFATCGFTLMVVVQQLLVAFLAIELASLSLYLLTGFDRRRPESAEAALKYYLFGGMSAAFLWFGFSLIYGVTGAIELPQIAAALAAGGPTAPLVSIALVMIVVAFGFKAAAAPFHLWAPDVYQGAPAPAAALVASASKLAGLVVFTRLLWSGAGPVAGEVATPADHGGWIIPVALLAAASLLLGNLAALAQTNLRRLLAYSAIAHAGIMLLAVLVADQAGFGPMVYYAFTYALATVGAFGVVGALERAGVGPRLTDLAGLHRTSPLLAGCLMVFLLSLAGVPPLAGFLGKFGVFAAAFSTGNGVSSPAGWLALLGIAASAVALYYYLVVLKYAWVNEPDHPSGGTRLPVARSTGVILGTVALALLVLGLFPGLILNHV